MKQLIFLMSITLFLFTNCTKEHSKKWMVVDLTVTNAMDGSPAIAKVELEYSEKALFGRRTVKSDLGWTDSNGKMFIEEKIPGSANKCKIYIYGNLLDDTPDGVIDNLSKTVRNICSIEI